MKLRHLATGLVVMAIANHILANGVPRTPAHHIDSKPWTMSFKIFSTSPRFTFDNIGPGITTSLTYHESAYFYTKGNFSDLKNSNLSLGILQGATKQFGNFSPYAEIALNYYINDEASNTTHFDYDVGVVYTRWSSFAPKLEFDDFGNNRRSVMAGLVFPLSKITSFEADFAQSLRTNENTVMVRLHVIF